MENEFRGTARAVINEDYGRITKYYYHETAVVVHDRDNGGQVVLNSNGWRTATTKKAMNQASRQGHLGFDVFQKKGEWFVTTYCNTTPRSFYDGIVLFPKD